MENIFEERFFLSAGEVNAEGEMSIPLLTSRIIDVATAHANSLGIGNPSMQSLGCGWVLSRLAIEMTRYPKVNETYSISTWVEGWNRHFSTRNFAIRDAAGNALGYASSVWMVLNYVTRENAGLSHLHLAPDMICGEKVPIAKPRRHAVTAPTEPPREYTFKYCDLDFYRHVNTVRYVQLLINSFSLEEMDNNMVRRLDLAFMREGRYGETVKVLTQRDGNQIELALSDAAEGETLLGAGVELAPRD